MIKTVGILGLTSCVIFALTLVAPRASADPASLAWWFLPDAGDDLPHEIEEDDADTWTELWERPNYDSEAVPNTVMEQTLGARWVGMSPDKDGKPGRTIVVLAGKKIVDFSGEKARTGSLDDEKITWSDGTKQLLNEFRHRGRRRRRHGKGSATIKFEKMSLPPLAGRSRTLPDWGAENIDNLLSKLMSAPDLRLNPRDLSAVMQIEDPNTGLLNFRYAASCDFKDRQRIEDTLAEVEPKLTCWMSQNTEAGSRLLAALMQKPVIECANRPTAKTSLPSDACGMATAPLTAAFFPVQPKITLAMNRCENELDETLLHEIFHFAGIGDNADEMASARQDAESCLTQPASLDFDNESEGFLNDFQVQTRMFVFRKVRDEAVTWGWTEAERSFFLGTICARMGDKYCARNFFQKAAEGSLPGNVALPEGTEVSWSSLAQYEFYDSISEDIQRMHELGRYLHRDPNGTLLRRIEAGSRRVHEFFVARQALATVLDNKRLCTGDTDDHVMCEDLAQIVRTPWFKNQ